MNCHKPPIYPASSLHKNKHGPVRGMSSYTESSPPAEINDDVLPVHPSLPTSTANQGIINHHALSQKSFKGARHSIPKQTNKMSQRNTIMLNHQIPHFTQQSVTNASAPSPSQTFDSVVGVPSSGILPHSHGTDPAKAITADRQLGFSRPAANELRDHVQDILRSLNTYPLNDCHDKVRWFATVVLQQLLDLELYTACSTAVEQCCHIQQKRAQQQLVILRNEKRKIDQEKKQLASQKSQLTKEKEELTKCKEELEQKVKTLAQYEAKCQTMKREEDKLKMDKQNLIKELDEVKKQSEESATKADRMGRERDVHKRRLDEQELVMKRTVSQLEEELAVERSKKCTALADMTARAGNPTEISKAKFNELKQEFKSKKAELKQLRTEMAQQREYKQRCDDLEEQLRVSNESLGKFRHKAMKLNDRLRRKIDQMEEQKVQLADAISGKQRMEEELNKTRQQNARLIKISHQKQGRRTDIGGRGEEETIVVQCTQNGASQTASCFEQFNDRIRSITKKKRALDKALVSIGVQPKKCPKHSPSIIVGKESTDDNNNEEEDEGAAMGTTITAAAAAATTVVAEMPSGVNNTTKCFTIEAEEDIISLASIVSEGPTTTANVGESGAGSSVTDINDSNACNEQGTKKMAEKDNNGPPVVTLMKIDNAARKSGSQNPDGNIDMVTDGTDQNKQQQPSASKKKKNVNGSKKRSKRLKRMIELRKENPKKVAAEDNSGPPVDVDMVADATDQNKQPSAMPSSFSSSSSSTTTPIVVEQQQKHYCPPSSVITPNADPAPTGNQKQQQQSVAEQIVTSFIRYISQRPGQDARSLVTEYLQKSFIPVQFHALIAPQLDIIASTSENARHSL